MKKSFRLILFGALLWIIPFVAAFAFYDSTGKLTTSYDLFKSSMIVISSLVGAYFIFLYFKPIVKDFVKEGVMVGLIWLAINLVLDIFILVPFAKMAMKDYFASIGLRYLQIPIFTFVTGDSSEPFSVCVNKRASIAGPPFASKPTAASPSGARCSVDC